MNSVTGSGMGPPASVNNQDNPLQSCPQTNLINTITWLKFLVCLVLFCVKLTVNADCATVEVKYSQEAKQTAEHPLYKTLS